MTAHLRHSSPQMGLAADFVLVARDEVNAGAGTRTRTPLRARDFKSPLPNGKQRKPASNSGNSGNTPGQQSTITASGESRTAHLRHSCLSPRLIVAAYRRVRP